MEQRHLTTTPFISLEERAHLIRFCTTLSGRPDIAEDLTQETLLEAWRHEQALRDPSRRSQWLTGIARNVYLRWRRKQGRDEAHLYQENHIPPEQDTSEADQLFIDDYSIELDLERKELVELLDRALTLLPAETRTVLIKHYIEDSPLKDLAQQLGTSTNALAVRLQRGKLAMRRLLTQDMQEEFAAHNEHTTSTIWEVTPIWCYYCGRQRLLGQRESSKGKLLLKCPVCSPDKNELLSRNELLPLQHMKSYRPMLARVQNWCHEHYRAALATLSGHGTIACYVCKQPLIVLLAQKEELPAWIQADMFDFPWSDGARLVATFCTHCQKSCCTSFSGLISTLPEVRTFARAHEKMRISPSQPLEAEGRPALMTRVESITEHAELIIISDAETYDVLRIEQEG